MGRAPLVLLVLALLVPARDAQAWIFPEHRDITQRGFQILPPAAQAFYAALWAEARTDYAPRLCAAPVRSRTDPADCIELTTWPALAGDHSCSPNQLLHETLASRWVQKVIDIGTDVGERLARADAEDERQNIWADSNLRLQVVDEDYITRAGGNNAHFLLPWLTEQVESYAARSARAGQPLNALGLYLAYHTAAVTLVRAAGVGVEQEPVVRAERARRVLALEAYALHFLEDIFSSGHVAGSWGDTATRKGTHDYYSANGLSEVTWSGVPMTMFGDAHMRPADLRRGAEAVARSLADLYSASLPGAPSVESSTVSRADAMLDLDSCKRLVEPEALPLDFALEPQLTALLGELPVPGYGPGMASWPRFRADFGPFVGLTSLGALGPVFSGYGGGSVRLLAELGFAARFGYGLEGVLGSSNAGTMFLQVGVMMQAPQKDSCPSSECSSDVFGSSNFPRVPARAGLNLGLRVPFWLVPGDLLLLGPVLGLTSPKTLTRVAMQAASGGLIPWQRSFATPIGGVAVVAGRFVSVDLYGVLGGPLLGFADQKQPDGSMGLAAMAFRSATLTFPVVEYTPLRVVAQKLTTALRLELAYAVDIPFDTNFLPITGAKGPDLGVAHMALVVLSADGRAYF